MLNLKLISMGINREKRVFPLGAQRKVHGEITEYGEKKQRGRGLIPSWRAQCKQIFRKKKKRDQRFGQNLKVLVTIRCLEKENIAREGDREEKSKEAPRSKKQHKKRHHSSSKEEFHGQHSVFHCRGTEHTKRDMGERMETLKVRLRTLSHHTRH